MALLVAAGSGSRAGGEVPKQYRDDRRQGRCSPMRSTISPIRAIDAVQVVIGAGQEEAYRAAVGDARPPRPGHRRRDPAANRCATGSTALGEAASAC